jgi:hypothetical protein
LFETASAGRTLEAQIEDGNSWNRVPLILPHNSMEALQCS